jgi:hypothetical protein
MLGRYKDTWPCPEPPGLRGPMQMSVKEKEKFPDT